jgi:hypothetical protein
MFTLICFGVHAVSSYGFLTVVRHEFTVITLGMAFGVVITSAALFSQCTSAQSATEEVSNSRTTTCVSHVCVDVQKYST